MSKKRHAPAQASADPNKLFSNQTEAVYNESTITLLANKLIRLDRECRWTIDQ